jgi:hypothetical protein
MLLSMLILRYSPSHRVSRLPLKISIDNELIEVFTFQLEFMTQNLAA